MRKRSQRLWLIGAAAILLTGAVALVAIGGGNQFAFFADPTDLLVKAPKQGQPVRLGGLVAAKSVHYTNDGKMEFDITDGKNARRVTFDGLKPDMFQEGQGMIAEGVLNPEGVLVARKLIAKHDESYMPKDVYDSLRKRAGEAGVSDYKPGGKPAPGAGS